MQPCLCLPHLTLAGACKLPVTPNRPRPALCLPSGRSRRRTDGNPPDSRKEPNEPNLLLPAPAPACSICESSQTKPILVTAQCSKRSQRRPASFVARTNPIESASARRAQP